ncbi:unnamed protein product [Knipowitschia caucasica]
MSVNREELVPKKGTVTFVVWNWFAFSVSDAKQITPHCKVCLKAIATKGSSTTNLFQHLKQKHAAEWEACASQRRKQDRTHSLGKFVELYPL